MRVLLTGANGQVGWELRRSLAPLGEVIATDRATCDLSHPEGLPRIIRDIAPDLIVNAAAYTAVDDAEAEEALATTVNGAAVGQIAEEARRLGTLLIHYSTAFVFDGTKATPYTEDDPPHPINAYGRSKLAGERAIQQCGGRYLILRTSWVYAARGRNFVRTILALARERGELRIVTDQIGAPTWARDIADSTASIARQARHELDSGSFKPGSYNLTAAGAASRFGFAEAILDEAARQPGALRRKPALHSIASRDYPLPATRPKNSCLTGERVAARFGIALPDWHDALARCMAEAALLEAG